MSSMWWPSAIVEVVFAGELDELRAALRTAPVAVELAAFLEAAFHGYILEVERNLWEIC